MYIDSSQSYYYLIGGLEQNAYNYLQSFAVNSQLKLTKDTGAFMTSVMSACVGLSRLASIFVSMHKISIII